MTAATATLSEALGFLEGTWAHVTQGILRGQYTLWLGSAISRDRFPMLRELMLRLLEELHTRSNLTDVACPFQRTLGQILSLTTHNGIDIKTAPATWPRLEEVLLALVDKYPDVLDQEVRVPGGAALSVIWDILKLDELYDDVRVDPDADHRFLALLMEEGVLKNLITTNWDPLIERAHERCRGSKPSDIHIVVSPDDLTGAQGARAKVIKFHGCSRRCHQDPARYRQFVVATRAQITAWPRRTDVQPIQDALRTTLRMSPALFVGLSGQDWNIQAELFSAFIQFTNFAGADPKVVFTVTEITNYQRTILKLIYGDDAFRANPDGLEAAARMELYSKPLMGALYILMVLERAKAAIELANDLSPGQKVLAEAAVATLKRAVCGRFDVIADIGTRWRQLAAEVPRLLGHFISIFRDSKTLENADHYSALYCGDIAQMRADPNLSGLGFQWVLLAFRLFQLGQEQGIWEIVAPSDFDGQDGQFLLRLGGTREIAVFLLRDGATGAAALEQNSILAAATRDCLIVYSNQHEPRRRSRSPTRILPGSSKGVGVPELWLRDLIDEARNDAETIGAIQSQMVALGLI